MTFLNEKLFKQCEQETEEEYCMRGLSAGTGICRDFFYHDVFLRYMASMNDGKHKICDESSDEHNSGSKTSRQ